MKNMVQSHYLALEGWSSVGDRVGEKVIQGIQWVWKISRHGRKWEQRAVGRRKQQARHLVMEDYQVSQAWHPRGEFMVTTHGFPALPVPANGFQDELLHHLSRDWGDADQPLVPWVLPALSEGRSDSGSAPVPPATTIIHTLPRAVSWWHQWGPPVLMGTSHQGPWIDICPASLSVPWPGHFPPKLKFPSYKLSLGL